MKSASLFILFSLLSLKLATQRSLQVTVDIGARIATDIRANLPGDFADIAIMSEVGRIPNATIKGIDQSTGQPYGTGLAGTFGITPTVPILGAIFLRVTYTTVVINGIIMTKYTIDYGTGHVDGTVNDQVAASLFTPDSGGTQTPPSSPPSGGGGSGSSITTTTYVWVIVSEYTVWDPSTATLTLYRVWGWLPITMPGDINALN